MDLHDPRIAKPRTLDELKADVIDRVKNNGYPGRGLPLASAAAAMTALRTLDPDDWAAVWIVEADKLMAQANGTGDAGVRFEAFKQAFGLYTMGRFPARTTPGKRAAYDKSLDAYLAYTGTLPQPMEVVRIPFEGKEIIAYFRRPDGPGPFPLMIQCGGLDYLNEQIADQILLISRGDPKDAWINPKGMYMGFSADWPAARVDNEIIIPWFRRRIEFGARGAAQPVGKLSWG